jgi:hypothetical protein
VAILEQGSEYLYEDVYMRSWDLAKGLLGTFELYTPALLSQQMYHLR